MKGPKIGILGGTGPAGGNLGLRLADVGFEVVLGSRDASRAVEVRDALIGGWPGRGLTLQAGDNAEAAEADIVVIATPWDAAAQTTRTVADRIAGKVTISMANAMARADGQFVPLLLPRGSVAGDLQSVAPGCRVVAGLHHIPAAQLGALDDDVEADVLLCSDHEGAADEVAAVVGRIPGVRVLDAGRLANATAIEAFTSVLLQLNGNYRGHAGLRITGVGARR